MQSIDSIRNNTTNLCKIHNNNYFIGKLNIAEFIMCKIMMGMCGAGYKAAEGIHSLSADRCLCTVQCMEKVIKIPLRDPRFQKINKFISEFWQLIADCHNTLTV